MLSTFQYYGITDTTDLSAIKWKNGGYDISQLNDLYVNNNDSALAKKGRGSRNSKSKYKREKDNGTK